MAKANTLPPRKMFWMTPSPRDTTVEATTEAATVSPHTRASIRCWGWVSPWSVLRALRRVCPILLRDFIIGHGDNTSHFRGDTWGILDLEFHLDESEA
nr:hypothetical protein [Tanacetum cinerariifolium]